MKKRLLLFPLLCILICFSIIPSFATSSTSTVNVKIPFTFKNFEESDKDDYSWWIGDGYYNHECKFNITNEETQYYTITFKKPGIYDYTITYKTPDEDINYHLKIYIDNNLNFGFTCYRDDLEGKLELHFEKEIDVIEPLNEPSTSSKPFLPSDKSDTVQTGDDYKSISILVSCGVLFLVLSFILFKKHRKGI